MKDFLNKNLKVSSLSPSTLKKIFRAAKNFILFSLFQKSDNNCDFISDELFINEKTIEYIKIILSLHCNFVNNKKSTSNLANLLRHFFIAYKEHANNEQIIIIIIQLH